jgi:hypothetical protein
MKTKTNKNERKSVVMLNTRNSLLATEVGSHKKDKCSDLRKINGVRGLLDSGLRIDKVTE